MKILHRYIFRKCLFNTVSLLFAFGMIYSIINAINELGDVGKGSYTVMAMLVYLCAQLPSYLYLLMPLSVLIGVMTAMLGLVKNSEYAIMRTSGISLLQITRVLAVYGIVFALITFAIGEAIAPEASHFASVYKMNKLNQQMSTELSSGIWSKDGENNIINIKKLNQNDINVIDDINIYTYGEDLHLDQRISANHGIYKPSINGWQLESVTLYRFEDNKIHIEQLGKLDWPSTIDPSYFKVLVIAPEDMPAFSLIKYIDHLHENHQATNKPEIAMWSKLMYPIACISMAFIAIGFIPNNGRNVNLSTKLFAGILIGVSFFFSNKLVGFMAILYNWNPIISATLPTLILFTIGGFVVMKKEA